MKKWCSYKMENEQISTFKQLLKIITNEKQLNTRQTIITHRSGNDWVTEGFLKLVKQTVKQH